MQKSGYAFLKAPSYNVNALTYGNQNNMSLISESYNGSTCDFDSHSGCSNQPSDAIFPWCNGNMLVSKTKDNRSTRLGNAMQLLSR